MKKTSLLCLLALITTSAYAEKHDYQYIKQAAERWALAMASGNADKIMRYYNNRAVLAADCKQFFNTSDAISNH